MGEVRKARAEPRLRRSGGLRPPTSAKTSETAAAGGSGPEPKRLLNNLADPGPALAGPLLVLALVSVAARPGLFGSFSGGVGANAGGGTAAPGVYAAAIAGLIASALAGSSLPHLDRPRSLACRLFGRRARYAGGLLSRFGYAGGVTHTALGPTAATPVILVLGYYLFGAYGVAVGLALTVGYVSHVFWDLLVRGEAVGLLWPVGRQRVSLGAGTPRVQAGQGRTGWGSRLAGAVVEARAARTGGWLAPAAVVAASAYLVYSTLMPLVSATAPGFFGRTLEGAIRYVSEPASIPLGAVAGLGLGLALWTGSTRLLVAGAERAAARAAGRSEYGGLASHLIRPTSKDNELQPERLRRLLGRLPVPEGGLYPEISVGARVGAVVSGQEAGDLVERLHAEYMMDATVAPLSMAEALTGPPGGIEASKTGSGEARKGSGSLPAHEEGLPYDSSDGQAVACRFELAGEVTRGTLGSSELVRHDPLAGALNGLRRSLDVTAGERALVQLCVRRPNEGSAAPVRERIAEIDEKAHEQGSSRRKGKRGLLWWALLVSPFGKLRDHYNRESLRKEIGEDRKEKVTAEEREERKALAERAKQPGFMVELRMLAHLAPETDPRAFLSAAGGYANAFDREGGACWRLAEEAAGERSALARRIALRLPGPPPGRDEERDLLTADELAAMWHPLGKSVDVEGRDVAALVTRPPYVGIPTGGLMVGYSNHPGYEDFGLYVEEAELDLGGELVGKTGNGKSTFVLSLLLPAIRAGIGVSLFDPKGGDLFTELVSALPASVLDKTILVDPGDQGFTCPRLNFLDPVCWMSPDDQADSIVRALEYRFPGGFGHNNRPIFGHALLACIAANVKLKEAGREPKFGLPDLSETGFLAPRVEIDPKENDYEQPPMRKEVLDHLRGDGRFEAVVGYWDNKDATQGAAQQGKEWNSITNKIGQLRNPNVAKVLSGGHSSFDLMDVMENGKLVLFNLSQGSMPGDTHELLGTLVLNLIARTAAVRHDKAVRYGDPKSLNRFVNVVDEVQNFLCPEMTKLLTEGRAMRCSLWAAHQYLHQIKAADKKMAEAFANAGTTVLFGTTHDDAKSVAEFIDDPRFTPAVVANMPKYQFVLQRAEGEPVTGQTVEMPGIDQTRVHKLRRWCAAAVESSPEALAPAAGSRDLSPPGVERAPEPAPEAAGGLRDETSGEPGGREEPGSTPDPDAVGAGRGSRFGDRESLRNEATQVKARIRGSGSEPSGVAPDGGPSDASPSSGGISVGGQADAGDVQDRGSPGAGLRRSSDEGDEGDGRPPQENETGAGLWRGLEEDMPG